MNIGKAVAEALKRRWGKLQVTPDIHIKELNYFEYLTRKLNDSKTA